MKEENHTHAIGHDDRWWDCSADKGQHYLHAVNHVMRCCRGGKGKCYSLPVGHDSRWDEMWWGCIAEINVSITHKLVVIGWDVMRLQGRNKCQCHSQTVGHGMRCDELASQRCHSHAVGHGMRCDETTWHRQNSMSVSLTCCGSWDVMWWDCMTEINVSVTHQLLVIGWDVMRLHCTNKWQCHSPAVGHGMKCDETAWQK